MITNVILNHSWNNLVPVGIENMLDNKLKCASFWLPVYGLINLFLFTHRELQFFWNWIQVILISEKCKDTTEGVHPALHEQTVRKDFVKARTLLSNVL